MTRERAPEDAGLLSPAGFDPWTATEAQVIDAAGAYSLAADGALVMSPLWMQWERAQYILAALRPRIESDADALATLEAVALCAEYRLVIPDWLARAFVPAVSRAVQFGVRSLDEAFGYPLKGSRIEDRRRQRVQDPFLWLSVRQFLRTRPDRTIDATLWEDVAAYINSLYPQLQVTGAQVDRAWRRMRASGYGGLKG